jgi:methionyl-tRNA formyltransferase
MSEPVRLVLVTGHVFGCRAFEGLFSSAAYLDGRIEPVLMIGLDDSRSAATVGYQSLDQLAASAGVPYVGTSDGRLGSLAARIRAARPAYILVIGWSYLVGDDILALAEHGGIGMHPTRLPSGRGQAPIPWTIIKGCSRTALSVFRLSAVADAGPVIAQYDLEIRDRETSASLFSRVGHTHFTAGRDLGELLGKGGVVPAIAQDESLATRWPRRRPRDGALLPGMSREELDRLVRAQLGPYPRAFLPGPVFVRAVSLGARDGWVRFPCRDGEVWLLPDTPVEQAQ